MCGHGAGLVCAARPYLGIAGIAAQHLLGRPGAALCAGLGSKRANVAALPVAGLRAV